MKQGTVKAKNMDSYYEWLSKLSFDDGKKVSGEMEEAIKAHHPEKLTTARHSMILAVSLPRRWCACRFQPAAQRVDADAEFRGHLPAGPPLLGDHPHCPRLEGLIVTRRRWVLSFFG